MQTNPATGEQLNKKVSAMNYYSNRIMIPQNGTNYILQCRQLFHQYVVDMYAKIESERLLFIRLNQKSLRSEEYIHLRDAIANDGNISDIGKMVILPTTFTGSPRHMHEYAQDAMTYAFIQMSRLFHHIHMQSSMGRDKRASIARSSSIRSTQFDCTNFQAKTHKIDGFDCEVSHLW